MAEEQAANTEQNKSISEQASAGGADGVRARRAFMLKFLLGGDSDWIMKNVVGKGKGTQVIVGRIFGVCTGVEDKTNVLPDGSPSKSIVLYGQYEYESAITGEIGQASSAYLPMAFADQIKAAFASDPATKMIEVDIDIGLEATGKTIPYEWLVVNHAGGEASLLTRLRSRRRPGQKALAPMPAPAALAAPATPAPEAATTVSADADKAKPDAAPAGKAKGK